MIRNSIPAYFRPGQIWERAIAVHPFLMVMNPASGPGDAPELAYQMAVRQARAKNVRIFGYVPTTYAARPASKVNGDVHRYAKWYSVNGIFFDECSSEIKDLAYYRNLRLNALPRWSCFNPGTYPAERYMSIGDIIVTEERSMSDYLLQTAPAWIYKYPSRSIWNIIYDVPTIADARHVIAVAKTKNAGHLWITNLGEPNPYSDVPPYYEELAALLKAA